MPNCNVGDYKEPHGGLQQINPDGGRDFEFFRSNFNDLIDQLTDQDSLKPSEVSKLFRTQGYYIGKEQLRCLLDKEFKEFDGLQIILGLSDTAKEGAEIVFLVRGAFPNGETASGAVKKIDIDGEDVDIRYFTTSDESYIAGPPLGNPTPAPNSMPIPPYGRG